MNTMILIISLSVAFNQQLQDKSKVDSLNTRVAANRGILITTRSVSINKTKSRLFSKNVQPKLLEKPDPLSKVLKTIPENTKILSTDYYDRYWKVHYDDHVGFIADVFVVSTDSTILFKKARTLFYEKEAEKLKRKQRAIESNKAWIKALKANIRQLPSKESRIVDSLEIGRLVYIQDETTGWFRIRWKDLFNVHTDIRSQSELSQIYQEGWIHKSLVSKSEVPKLSQYEIEAEKRRRTFLQKNPHISDRFRQAIINGQIVLGMTKEMAIASWGQPYDINRTVGSFGVHEQWVYGSDIRYRRYLYFENGVLKSWQD